MTRAAIRRAWDFLVHQEGSSRPAALIRIGLVVLVWTRYASDFLLYKNLEPYYLLHGFSLFVASTLLFFGAFTRLAAIWTAATLVSFYYYLGYAKGIEPYTHHHTYVLAVTAVLLACSPCGKSYSWDRWRALKKAQRIGEPPPAESGPQWALRLMVLQVSLIYFWSGFDKCNPAFLSGERMEHYAMYLYIGSDYPKSAWFHPAMVGLAWSTVFLEFALAFGLWWKRTHRVLIPFGMMFHAILYVLLPVGTYSLNMWLLYLAVLDPDEVHRFIDEISTTRTVA
jgi:hypothetical protein